MMFQYDFSSSAVYDESSHLTFRTLEVQYPLYSVSRL